MSFDRRKFLQASGMAIAGTATFSTSRTEASYSQIEEANNPSSDWPMFRGDTRNTGANQQATGPEKLEEKWSFNTNGRIFASPTVRDGLVCISSYDGNVYGINLDGDKEWEFDMGGYSDIQSSAAITGDTVYVGGRDGFLYAIDLTREEKEVKWRFFTGGKISSSPTVIGDMIYFGNDKGNVYGVHDTIRGSGDSFWTFETETNDPVFSSPAVSSGTVYVGSFDNNVYAIDALTGEEQGRFETDDSVGSSPAVIDGIVYVGSNDEHLYAIEDFENNELYWDEPTHLRSSVTASPAVADGYVYVGGWESGLYAVNTESGEVEWEFSHYNGFSSPAVTADTVYVGTEDGSVYGLDKDTGEPRQGPYETNNKIPQSSPAVVDDTVYIGCYDHNLYALGEAEDEGSSELLYSSLGSFIIGLLLGTLTGGIKSKKIRDKTSLYITSSMIQIVIATIAMTFGMTFGITFGAVKFGIIELNSEQIMLPPLFIVLGILLVGLIFGMVLGSYLRENDSIPFI